MSRRVKITNKSLVCGLARRFHSKFVLPRSPALSCHAAEAEARPKSAHKYNVAEQQQIYRSEVERIWKAQYDSLSRKNEPELSDHEEDAKATLPDLKKAQRRLSTFARESSPYGAAASPPAGLSSVPASPAFSRGSSVDREMSYGPEASKKVLRIKRMVSDIHGLSICFICFYAHGVVFFFLPWQVDGEVKYEIVRDPAVIAAYVRKRQVIDEETTLTDTLAPTGDAEKDARAKKRYVSPAQRPPAGWALVVLACLGPDCAERCLF